jgi:glucoamylase
MHFGHPTGGATPLVWAHGEYLKLARSIADKRVFDLIPEVAERYQKNRKELSESPGEIWMFRRQPATTPRGRTLRIHAESPFRLRWTGDEWKKAADIDSKSTGLGVYFCDIAIPAEQKSPIQFTFYWTESSNWEQRNFEVGICST